MKCSGHCLGGHALHHFFANPVVQLGDDLAGHQVADRDGQLGALVIVEQFEQVGDVGRVERLDQFVEFAAPVFLQRGAHRAEIFGLEAVFLVVPLVIDAVVGAAAFVGILLGCQTGRVDRFVEERIGAHGFAPLSGCGAKASRRRRAG